MRTRRDRGGRGARVRKPGDDAWFVAFWRADVGAPHCVRLSRRAEWSHADVTARKFASGHRRASRARWHAAQAMPRLAAWLVRDGERTAGGTGRTSMGVPREMARPEQARK